MTDITSTYTGGRATGSGAFAVTASVNAAQAAIVDDVSVFDLINLDLWQQTLQVREGLPAAYVAEMSDALSISRVLYLEGLDLPRSTIEARIKNKTPLTRAEGAAVLRSAKALRKAQEVLEDNLAAAQWFKRSNRSLGGVTPVSLMDTDSGYELVIKTLGRIEYGVVA